MNVRRFSKNLKLLLDERGMKQTELASMTGITEVSISRYVAGTRIPSVSIAKKIADAIGVDVDMLLCDLNDKEYFTKSEIREMFREYLGKMADSYYDMKGRCLEEDGHGASPSGCLSAFAHFEDRFTLAKYIIPGIVNEVLGEEK